MTTKTNNQESPETDRLLSSEEQAILSQIANTEQPYSQRAQAILAIDVGATQDEAGRQARLTKGQLRYWLGKFRKDGMSIFPEELLNLGQQEDEEETQQELPDAGELAGPVDEATTQREDTPEGKKKSKKKAKKIKKSKKGKKAKKGQKSKKMSKKKGSKKAKGSKGK